MYAAAEETDGDSVTSPPRVDDDVIAAVTSRRIQRQQLACQHEVYNCPVVI